MNEFSAQTGGRYTYVDDIVNLQDLALGFGNVFTECDNFIISGCKVSGNSISSGYIYLNGKIRKFNGVSSITVWPQFIYESNRTESVTYASGSDKVGRNIYGCTSGSAIPTSVDPLTNAIPVAIKITENGGMTMKDAWFGKYALLLNPTNSPQTANGQVIFNNQVTLKDILNANGNVVVNNGNHTLKVSSDGTTGEIKSQIVGGKAFSIKMSDANDMTISVNDTPILSINSSGVVSNFVAGFKGVSGGNVFMTGSSIYNYSTNEDTATLYINCEGYNGGATRFRNTIIGNGKGKGIITVNGALSNVSIAGLLSLESSDANGLVLKSNKQKSDVTLVKNISWTDSDNNEIAFSGFSSTADMSFAIKNSIGKISLTALDFVDLGPKIKENGVFLESKYVKASDYTSGMALKANASEYYSKTDADGRFANKTLGSAQFISATYTKERFRSDVGAVSLDDLTGHFPAMASLLSDMANTADKKKTICDNIGAAMKGDYQATLKDTGWIEIEPNLFVKQYGNVVQIAGKVVTKHTGSTMFTLPNNIDAPSKHTPFYISNENTIGFEAGSKACIVYGCSHHGETRGISITYLV